MSSDSRSSFLISIIGFMVFVLSLIPDSKMIGMKSINRFEDFIYFYGDSIFILGISVFFLFLGIKRLVTDDRNNNKDDDAQAL